MKMKWNEMSLFNKKNNNFVTILIHIAKGGEKNK